jgi:DNA-binding Lrp family transcriptional regulator
MDCWFCGRLLTQMEENKYFVHNHDNDLKETFLKQKEQIEDLKTRLNHSENRHLDDVESKDKQIQELQQIVLNQREAIDSRVKELEFKDEQMEQLKNELSQWSFIGDSAATDVIHDRLHIIPKLRKQIQELQTRISDIKFLADGIMRDVREPDKVYLMTDDILQKCSDISAETTISVMRRCRELVKENREKERRIQELQEKLDIVKQFHCIDKIL